MVAAELIKRSPIRILERTAHGGPGIGNAGLFIGPKGAGKTACLVHLATDRLLQGRHVIHVSFHANTAHIIDWYEDIFNEIADRYHLDGAMEVHDSIIRKRIITNFEQGADHWESVEKTISTLVRDGGFKADTVIVDGYDFKPSDIDAFKKFLRFVSAEGLEVWLSASTAIANEPHNAVDKRYAELVTVIFSLIDLGDHIRIELMKDHSNPVQDCHLKLDPHILLIAEETEGRAT